MGSISIHLGFLLVAIQVSHGKTCHLASWHGVFRLVMALSIGYWSHLVSREDAKTRRKKRSCFIPLPTRDLIRVLLSPDESWIDVLDRSGQVLCVRCNPLLE
jgi:hypothetical protein